MSEDISKTPLFKPINSVLNDAALSCKVALAILAAPEVQPLTPQEGATLPREAVARLCCPSCRREISWFSCPQCGRRHAVSVSDAEGLDVMSCKCGADILALALTPQSSAPPEWREAVARAIWDSDEAAAEPQWPSARVSWISLLPSEKTSSYRRADAALAALQSPTPAVSSAVVELPEPPKLYVKPEVDQDDGCVCVRAYTEDGRGVVSFTIYPTKVLITETNLDGEPGRRESFDHEAFAPQPLAGYRLVPEEPTEEMVCAALAHISMPFLDRAAKAVYRAMLAAAPHVAQPPSSGAKE